MKEQIINDMCMMFGRAFTDIDLNTVRNIITLSLADCEITKYSKAVTIYHGEPNEEGFVRSLIKSIANIPQEETERKHGKWIYTSYYTWECSECKKNPTLGMGYVQSKDELFDFCPNCGADMRGEE